MHISLNTLLPVGLLLAAGANAAPAPVTSQVAQKAHNHTGKSFKIDRVHNPHHNPNGKAALRKAYQKFSIPIPIGLLYNPNGQSHVAGQGGQGSGHYGNVTATPEANDIEYLAPVTVGSTELMLNFDTGSSDLWVFNTNLPAAQTRGHSVYNPNNSTYAPVNGSTFKLSYGDGSSVSGKVGTDTVNVGGATATGQAVELATQISNSFVADVDSDGLLGLAFSQINSVTPNKQKTFFDNVSDDLDQPVFTANLKHNTVGSYEFGTIDNSQFKDELSYVKVDSSEGYWQFDQPSFTINGNRTVTNSKAIADTGTSLLLADNALVSAYWSAVQGAHEDDAEGGYVFPCSASLPDLTLELGDSGYAAIVPGNLLSYTQVSSTTCYGGLQTIAGAPFQVFGDILFKAQFVAFDVSDNQPKLGFAYHSDSS
ncbi:putative extracellular aspartic endopeptidase [Xylona heveae TC161]|uniref:Putative extracellular aspartic endopeptidase n=1 Tax=Xylona heveae (strain CBS 132557 / TC161) TaxID=1328760 RepID=A0A165HBS6_XYLHT|nr:putative extracellular aspartic endopeptidase [Xylona heveae TC161]KZF23268.1 putative extracellular aspartic endopeptidase [Xylona heveae TC161]